MIAIKNLNTLYQTACAFGNQIKTGSGRVVLRYVIKNVHTCLYIRGHSQQRESSISSWSTSWGRMAENVTINVEGAHKAQHQAQVNEVVMPHSIKGVYK